MFKRYFTLVVALSAFALAGCGGAKTGVVTGSIDLEGEAVTFGTVTFIATDGRVDRASIEPDGKFTLKAAPIGDGTLTVQTYPLPPQVQPPDVKGKAGPPAAQLNGARYVPIPAIYADAHHSPIKLSVKAGEQTFDVKLKKRP